MFQARPLGTVNTKGLFARGPFQSPATRQLFLLKGSDELVFVQTIHRTFEPAPLFLTDVRAHPIPNPLVQQCAPSFYGPASNLSAESPLTLGGDRGVGYLRDRKIHTETVRNPLIKVLHHCYACRLNKDGRKPSKLYNAQILRYQACGLVDYNGSTVALGLL